MRLWNLKKLEDRAAFRKSSGLLNLLLKPDIVLNSHSLQTTLTYRICQNDIDIPCNEGLSCPPHWNAFFQFYVRGLSSSRPRWWRNTGRIQFSCWDVKCEDRRSLYFLVHDYMNLHANWFLWEIHKLQCITFCRYNLPALLVYETSLISESFKRAGRTHFVTFGWSQASGFWWFQLHCTDLNMIVVSHFCSKNKTQFVIN